MSSLVESLGREGILVGKFNLWESIRDAEAGYEIALRDSTPSMEFPFQRDALMAFARRRLGDAIEYTCDRLGLIREYPLVEEGQEIPAAPPGKRYYQDWYRQIADMVVRVRNGSSELTPK